MFKFTPIPLLYFSQFLEPIWKRRIVNGIGFIRTTTFSLSTVATTTTITTTTTTTTSSSLKNPYS